MKKLNKKSLKQQGGQSTKKQQVDPIVQLANSFSEMTSIGYEPKDIIIQFMDQAVPEDMIQATLARIGYSNNDIQKLFAEINNPKVEKERNAFNDLQAMLQQYDSEQDGLPQAQLGFRGTVNMNRGYNAPDTKYLPMDLANKGNVLGALGVLYDTVAPHLQGPYSSNLFGNKVDPETGFKKGLFKQMGKKSKARKLNKYSKYTLDDYDIKEDPKDPEYGNYVYDLKDLYEGKLSTKEQYKDRIKKYSEFSWDPEAKNYYGRATAHPTNLDAYGPAHQEKLKKFWEQSRTFDEFETQTDPQTKAAIKEFQRNAPPGYSFRIDKDGRLHYVRPGADNPDEISTMMGRNTGQFGPEDGSDPNMGDPSPYPFEPNTFPSFYKHGGIVGDPDEPKTGSFYMLGQQPTNQFGQPHVSLGHGTGHESNVHGHFARKQKRDLYTGKFKNVGFLEGNVDINPNLNFGINAMLPMKDYSHYNPEGVAKYTELGATLTRRFANGGENDYLPKYQKAGPFGKTFTEEDLSSEELDFWKGEIDTTRKEQDPTDLIKNLYNSEFFDEISREPSNKLSAYIDDIKKRNETPRFQNISPSTIYNKEGDAFDINYAKEQIAEKQKNNFEEYIYNIFHPDRVDKLAYGGENYLPKAQIGIPGFNPAGLEILMQEAAPYIEYEKYRIKERENNPYYYNKDNKLKRNAPEGTKDWRDIKDWKKRGDYQSLPHYLHEYMLKEAQKKKQDILGRPDFDLYSPEELEEYKMNEFEDKRGKELQQKIEDIEWYGGGWRKKYTDGKLNETLPQYYKRKCDEAGCDKPVMNYGGESGLPKYQAEGEIPIWPRPRIDLSKDKRIKEELIQYYINNQKNKISKYSPGIGHQTQIASTQNVLNPNIPIWLQEDSKGRVPTGSDFSIKHYYPSFNNLDNLKDKIGIPGWDQVVLPNWRQEGGENDYLPKAQRGMMESLGYRKNKDGTYTYSGSDPEIIKKVKLYNQGITGIDIPVKEEPFTSYADYIAAHPDIEVRVDTIKNNIGDFNLTNPYSSTEGWGGKPTFIKGKTSPITSGPTVSDSTRAALNRPFGERKYGGENHLPSYQVQGEVSFDDWWNSKGPDYFEGKSWEEIQGLYKEAGYVWENDTWGRPEIGMAGGVYDEGEYLEDYTKEYFEKQYWEDYTKDNVDGYNSPKVTKKKNFFDSPGMNIYGAISEGLVAGAGVLNEVAKKKKKKEAENYLRTMSMADNAFGYYEDKPGTRGYWDENTGILQPHQQTNYTVQAGGEMQEFEVDDDMIQKLIAAGADIEYL